MCNHYRMDDKDWVGKWAADAESLINPMPACQVNRQQYFHALDYARTEPAVRPAKRAGIHRGCRAGGI